MGAALKSSPIETTTLVTEQEENLETYSLLLLDSSVDSKENNATQVKLRSLINYLLIFEEIDQCEQYIQSLSSEDRIVLIVSGRLGQYLVPRIHQLRQVSSIYVYCMDKQTHQQWANQFYKVKGVIVQFDELLAQIQSDQRKEIENKIDEPMSMNIFDPIIEHEQSTNEFNNQFIHSQILLNSFRRIKSTLKEKYELIELARNEYHGNDTQLDIVREFQLYYAADRAVWWYTRDSFVYRLLNKALRVQNIDLLFRFRFFIRDIEQQLNQYRCSTPVRLYRGLLMSNEELDVLKNSNGKFISMNTFFATSLSREQALESLQSSSIADDLQQVIFEIDANPRRDGVKPFANVTSLGYYLKEEVLIMLGSIFRLIGVHHDNDRLWTIRLVLCSDKDHDVESIFDHIRNEYGDGERNLLAFGHELRKMSKFDDAETYFRRLLNELPPDHGLIANCYEGLGFVADDRGDYDSSLEWYYKALEILEHTLRSDHPNIAYSYNNIGAVHEKIGDNKQALESYEKALMILQQVFGADHLDVAMCFNNMGNIYYEKKEYSEALVFYKQDLAISQKHFPDDHPDFGQSHLKLGLVYYKLGQYELALEHYRLSLKIFKKSLPPQDIQIAIILKNMGDVHEQKGDFQDALPLYEKAANIFSHSLPPTDPNVIKIEQTIRYVSSVLK